LLLLLLQRDETVLRADGRDGLALVLLRTAAPRGRTTTCPEEVGQGSATGLSASSEPSVDRMRGEVRPTRPDSGCGGR
jgi:hypothetical protein